MICLDELLHLPVLFILMIVVEQDFHGLIQILIHIILFLLVALLLNIALFKDLLNVLDFLFSLGRDLFVQVVILHHFLRNLHKV